MTGIVVIGGGGGVGRLLYLLKLLTHYIVSIQTVFDNGGDSAKWRNRGFISPGDLRRAVSAMSDGMLHTRLMDVVFPDEKIGNSLIAASFTLDPKNPYGGFEALCKMMGVQGKIFPISLQPADVVGWDSNGKLTKGGETYIDRMSEFCDDSVSHVYLEPDVPIFVGARDALLSAKKIIFAMGDPLTSIFPNTLVRGFRETILEWRDKNPDGKIGMVCNLMTKRSESPGWKASDFARRLARRLGVDQLDFCLVNTGEIPKDVMARYEAMGSLPVEVDTDLSNYVYRVYRDDFVEIVEDPERHIKTVRHNAHTAKVLIYDI